MTSIQWTILFLCAALIPVNGYPLLLSLRPWWTQGAGRALMVKAVANAAVIDGSLLTWLFGPHGIFEWTRVIGLVLFNVGIWSLFAVLALTPRNRGDDVGDGQRSASSVTVNPTRATFTRTSPVADGPASVEPVRFKRPGDESSDDQEGPPL